MTDSPDTAQRLREFGPLGIAAMLAIFASSVLGFAVTAILVLVWARRSNTPLRALGFRKPPHLAATLLIGFAFGIALKVVVKSIAMPLLGAPATNQTYHFLVGNAAALPFLIATALINASFGEEVFFRGYLFERLGALLGPSRAALFATVLVTAGAQNPAEPQPLFRFHGEIRRQVPTVCDGVRQWPEHEELYHPRGDDRPGQPATLLHAI